MYIAVLFQLSLTRDYSPNMTYNYLFKFTLQILGLKSAILPVTGWGSFPSVNIPCMLNWGHVYFYLVESAPQYKPLPLLECDEEYTENLKKNALKAGKTGLSRKGCKLLQSEKVLAMKDQQKNGIYYLMAEVQRSMMVETFFPSAIISAESGSIKECSCECKQRAMGRCSHVTAMLLSLVEHIETTGYSG